ncbi:MAG: tetratricopeptide repeat protein, partial [Bdellovibrionales bacterium]
LHLSKQGDWKKTLDILEDLPSSIIDKHHLILLVAEAQTKTGDPESALKTLKKSKMKDSVDASLFAGRIFEVIKPEMTKAKESYKKALSAAQEPLQKKWIEKKLGYLNGLKQ